MSQQKPSHNTPLAERTVERKEEMIGSLVTWLKDRGLGEAALLFLEASKPLTLIGSQAILLLQPVVGHLGSMLGWFTDDRVLTEYALLLEDPANVDRIVNCLEHPAPE